MFLLLIFFFSITIQSTISSCNSSEFYPCACCDPILHSCVHNAANPFSYIASCPIFQICNPICKLDSSTYCCVPKDFQGINIRKDNITIFNKFCKKNINRQNSMVNTIISSCDSISKKCFESKNAIAPGVLPKSTIKVLPPIEEEEEEEEITTRISTFIIEDDDNYRKRNVTKIQPINPRKMEDEETISIWVPERIPSKIPVKPINRSIRQFQSINFLLFISIFTIFSN